MEQPVDGESAAAWSSNDAEASSTPPRPRISRHSSLPRTLFGGGSTSIFGSPSEPPAPDTGTGISTGTGTVLATADQPEPLVTNMEDSNIRLSEHTTFSFNDHARPSVERRLPQVEKDVDDPTTPPSRARASRQDSTTLTTLSRLFAVQAAPSPEQSRTTSYIQAACRPATYNRSVPAETTALPGHLYTRGLLEGRHSDITVNAFGRQYKLHRLVLDRAPFFSSALSEPWLEANAKEITVKPDEIDSSITQTAFELALKRLYGCVSIGEEDADAVGLFATGCWLEMQDLIDSSIESMLRQMNPHTLSPLIRLMTRNYYGRAGDKILASAKAMLCRDGWNMPLKFWDGIPGDIVREIVGGDGFFIDGEWDRWMLAKHILDRRLKAHAIEAGLAEPGHKHRILKAPDTVSLMAVRFDTVYRRNSVSTGKGVPANLHRWISLYTHPDVEPLLVLIDEGIHYVHLDYEQLQYIRQARDCLGLPVMPEKVILNALWGQMEVRQKIMNARDPDLELGLSVQSTESSVFAAPSRDTTMSITSPASPPSMAKNKQKVSSSIFADDESVQQIDRDLDSGSWDGNGRPRKFWIPSSDCNIVMGGNAEPVIATSSNAALQRHANRISATLQPEDLQWAADFAAATSVATPPPRPSTADGIARAPEPAIVSYTHYPPFRFSAEFPNPRLLKERKRYYSRTVFYAGSLWNIYIQKIASSRSKQLGVYLHRAKERETEEVISGTAGLTQGSVDERIGQLEREMIMRSERHEQRRQRRRRRAMLDRDGQDLDGAESDGAIDSAGFTGGSGNDSLPRRARVNTRAESFSGVKLSEEFAHNSVLSPADPEQANDASEDSDDLEAEHEADLIASLSSRNRVPALPPYVDARPTIKTYFKIYSPSRGGRMLSVYESAPDKFNFSQSWGWKSSTLMLDEGLMGDDDDMPKGDEEERIGEKKRHADGRLKFSVVIGLI